MLHKSTKKRSLQDIILKKTTELDCDEICILSGFLGNGPIDRITELNKVKKITIVYGLALDTKKTDLHEYLKRIHEDKFKNVEIFYPFIRSHVKLYLWKKNGTVIYGLHGSANFSSKGLISPDRELLDEIDLNLIKGFEEYSKIIFDSSVPVNEYKFGKLEKKRRSDSDEIFISDSLFAEKSKINWGHGNAHTNIRDAYIPLNKKDIIDYPKLFPEKQNDKGLGNADNEPIDVLWDDGTSMVCLLEGTQTIDKKRYPNKISSYDNKKILGDYLRKRMEINEGDFVTEEAFRSYGRDNVTISKTSDEVYRFDFGIKK